MTRKHLICICLATVAMNGCSARRPMTQPACPPEVVCSDPLICPDCPEPNPCPPVVDCPEPIVQIYHTGHCLDGLPHHLIMQPGLTLILKAGTGAVSLDVTALTYLHMTAPKAGWHVQFDAVNRIVEFPQTQPYGTPDHPFIINVEGAKLIRLMPDATQDVTIECK